MNFNESFRIYVILKVTNNQGYNFFLENAILRKPQGGIVKLARSLFRVNVAELYYWLEHEKVKKT